MYFSEIGRKIMKNLRVLLSIVIFISLSFANQESDNTVITNKTSNSIIDHLAIIPAYTNAEGMTYSVKFPSFDIKTSLTQENCENLLVNAYLNDRIIMENSLPMGNFTWKNFENSKATFTINEDENWCVFINKDDTNKIYFELIDESQGIHEVSDVISYKIENTAPTIDIYDADGDMILGTHGSNSHDVWIFAEVYDPESSIRLSNCSMTIQTVGGEDQMVIPGEAFDIVEEYVDGFKLRKAINYADFVNEIWNMDIAEQIKGPIEIILTVGNRIGMIATKKSRVSFDLLDPVISLESYSWEVENNDFKINDDLPLYFTIDISDPESCNGCENIQIYSAVSGIDVESIKLYVDEDSQDLVIDGNRLFIELPPISNHGDHIISLSVLDKVGRASQMGFKIFVKHSTSIENTENLPTEFSLNQSYPNPFNPTTTISYSLAKDTDVMLTIYDALGNEVETIVNEQKTAGYHHINWDASAQPSGVYFYKLTTDGFTDMKKCMFLK